MGPINGVLLLGGAVLIGVGLLRARAPWTRYRELRLQDENIARYEAWRGGIRDDSKTGASVAMEILRRQARMGALVAIFGAALVVTGFVVR